MKTLTTNSTFSELFSTELWTAHQVAGLNCRHRKVISIEALEHAFMVSKCRMNIKLHNEHSEKLEGVLHQVNGFENLLKDKLEEIEKRSGFRPHPEHGFDVRNYLNKSWLRVHHLLEWRGRDAVCFPRRDVDDLVTGMNDYHAYCFYQTYMDFFSMKEFVERVIPLKASLERMKVADHFLWDDEGVWKLILKEAGHPIV